MARIIICATFAPENLIYQLKTKTFMKKFLLLSVSLLLLGVGGAKVYAGKKYWSPKSWVASWNGETNTMSWNGSDYYKVMETNFPKGDLSSYTKITFNITSITGDNDYIQLKVVSEGKSDKLINLSEGVNNIFLLNYDDINWTNVTELTLWGTGSSDGSAVITNAYLQKPADINNGFKDEITSLDYITGGGKFVISDNGTKAKYFYGTGSGSGENENKNANVEDVPADAYCYFTLVKYTGGDVVGDNIYRIKITNAEDEGYPYGSNDGYYLNAIKTYNSAVIAGPEAGWSEAGNEIKDALWYVTYDAEHGFSFQNVYRIEHSASSWLSLEKDFNSSKKYLKLYKSIDINSELDDDVLLEFNEYGIATTEKRRLVASGGLSYDSSTGVLTTDGTVGTLTLEFANPVDLKNLYKFTVNRSGNDNIIDNVKFYDADNTEINTWKNSKLQNDGLDNNATNAFINHNPVKKLVWSSAADKSTDWTLTITGITWQLKTMSCLKAGETVLNSMPYQNMSGETITPTWNVLTSTDTYYGTSDGTNAVSYTDITECSELRIYRDNNTGFRAFFIDAAGTKVNTINHENAASTWNAEGKYWSIDLSKVEKYEGKVALQSIKSAAYGQYNIVNNIVVYQAPAANAPKYVLAGCGFQLAETVAALADETATAIDATGVTGITTNSEAGRTLLTSANPNCLFLGTTGNGGLANTQNVITSGVCASLALSDGNPFRAPDDFTATSVTYNRALIEDQTTTVCLPFALSTEEAATMGKFYTLTSLDGETLNFTRDEDEISANTPYLFVPSATAFEEYSSKSIDATPASLSVAGTGCTFIGTMERTLLKSDGSNTIYAYNNGSFVQIGSTNGAYLPAFRAYISIPSGVSVKALNIKLDDTETAISEVKKEGVKSKKTIFNVAGQRMSKLQKGLNIVNGKKVLVK